MVKRTDASTGKIIDDGKTDENPGVDENGRKLLKVKVYSPFHLYFDGPAYSITGVNRTGEFDVLPQHHNFISLLEPCELRIETQREAEPIKISGGIMHVRGDSVVVFLDV